MEKGISFFKAYVGEFREADYIFLIRAMKAPFRKFLTGTYNGEHINITNSDRIRDEIRSYAVGI
jgi:hypothetical protein